MGTLPKTYTGPGLFDAQLNGYAGVNFHGDPGAWTDKNFHHVRSTMRRRGMGSAREEHRVSEA